MNRDMKEKVLAQKCPKCGTSLVARICDRTDHIRKIGCAACGVWGENALTNNGGMTSFKHEVMERWGVAVDFSDDLDDEESEDE